MRVVSDGRVARNDGSAALHVLNLFHQVLKKASITSRRPHGERIDASIAEECLPLGQKCVLDV